MIQQIFFPERIGSYYLFGKRTVGIDIGLTEIYATIARAHGRTRTIEKLIEEPINADSTIPYETRVIAALTSLKSKLGRYDELCLVIPSSVVIFKELTLPFTGIKKIKMVVPFEVESQLPFTLDQAVIDSLITREDGHSTDLLVAATKRDLFEQQVNLFKAAGLTLDRVSIDMFELSGLYTMAAADPQKTVALVDLGVHSTRIGLLIKGQLKHIRSLPQGLLSIAKKIGQSTGLDLAENLQQLMRRGLDQSEFAHAAQGALEELFSTIRFTIESYAQPIDTLVLTGSAVEIPGLTDSLSSFLHLPVEPFLPKQLIHTNNIQSKLTSLPTSFIVSIAAALSVPSTESFNLETEDAQNKERKIETIQLITAAGLTLLLFTAFSLYSFFRIRTLRLAHKAAEVEAIEELKKSFRLKPGQTPNLTAANKLALTELKKQESAWLRLSSENRTKYLQYLSELSRCINIKEAQLELTSLVMKDEVIRLYGSVPGYPQLTLLQKQLECPLFKKLPKLQELTFKTEPITLIVTQEER